LNKDYLLTHKSLLKLIKFYKNTKTKYNID